MPKGRMQVARSARTWRAPNWTAISGRGEGRPSSSRIVSRTPTLPYNRRRLIALLGLLGFLALLAGAGRPDGSHRSAAALPGAAARFPAQGVGRRGHCGAPAGAGAEHRRGHRAGLSARLPAGRRLVPDEHALQVLGAGLAPPGAGGRCDAAGRVGRGQPCSGLVRCAAARGVGGHAGGRPGLPGCRRAGPRSKIASPGRGRRSARWTARLI